MIRLLRHVLITLLLLVAVAAAWLWHVNYNDGVQISDADQTAAPATAQERLAMIERGAYLAKAGNCMGCHTARGREPWTGGRAIGTPFGTLYSSNLTPDPDTGLGRWSSTAFWRAMHNGRSLDGHLLYPAFPYTHTTRITREDSDAIHAYLQSLEPIRSEVPPHELQWPYGTQLALAVWRGLYFEPGTFQPDSQQDAQWNRGAYLVQGLAHCSACHTPRDHLGGGDWKSLSGGVMPGQGWYAPSLLSEHEAGVRHWSADDIVSLLKTGHSRDGSASVSGPMAEVVNQSTQFLSDDDLSAMATFLQSLPPEASSHMQAQNGAQVARAPGSRAISPGQNLYETHCASCHGTQGQGVPHAYPPLAGNRAVTLSHTENLLQTVLYGGYGVSTHAHPRPFGMPPFVLELNDAELSAVLSYIRNSWGNRASEVSRLDVHNMRTAHTASR